MSLLILSAVLTLALPALALTEVEQGEAQFADGEADACAYSRDGYEDTSETAYKGK